MTPEERRSLAEQITSNPLFTQILDELEESAIERMVSAKDDQTRLSAQLRVQEHRALREALGACLENPTRKAAPA